MRDASNPPQFPALEELVRTYPQVFVDAVLHPCESEDEDTRVAILCCRAAVETVQVIHGRHCPHLLRGLLSHSHFLSISDRKHDALSKAERAWHLCVGQLDGAYLPEMPWACAVYADRLNRLGRHAEAEAAVKRACRIMTQCGEGCFSLGAILDLQWQYVEALRAQGRRADDAWKRQLDRYRKAWRDQMNTDRTEEGRAGR